MYLVTNFLPFIPSKADLSLFRLIVSSKFGLDIFCLPLSLWQQLLLILEHKKMGKLILVRV